MALKRTAMCFASTLTYHPANPDRTARRTPHGIGADTIFQEWPSRVAMARSIRMQQKRETKSDDWQACVKLGDGEGY